MSYPDSFRSFVSYMLSFFSKLLEREIAEHAEQLVIIRHYTDLLESELNILRAKVAHG